jgi:polyvinyl alcohol dehydrogenase (cytochrome)
MSGQNLQNTRYQAAETTLGVSNASRLAPAWVDTLAGDVSATPAVVDGAVYVPDWGGKVWKLDAKSGKTIWQTDLATALGQPAGTVVSRTAPAVSGGDVFVGTQASAHDATTGAATAGGLLLKLNASTGALVWSTTIDRYANPFAIDTQSPVVYKGVVYVGVASTEEAAVAFGVPCCSFRGNFSAISASTGRVLWTTDTIDNASYAAGYRGVGVWGSTAVIDQQRNYVYVDTGNDYTAPQSVEDCQAAWTQGTPYTCEDGYPGNHVDAVMALDLTTGAIAWATRLELYDAWNVACFFGTSPEACPNPAGPDYDFGQGAMLIKNTKVGDVLAAGQKSGVLWGLDPATGAVKWSNQVGPGSSLGGLEWGSATDGKRIYYAIVNLYGIPFPITNPAPGSATTTYAGLLGAVDAATGAPVWQRADPNGTIDLGPVSVANGVMYASSFGGNVGAPDATTTVPTMYAMNAATGAVLWHYVTGDVVNAGPAIANGMLFWGTGYRNQGFGNGNGKFFAFH